ncbi:MAG: hypothetical protein NTV56_17185 [Alphaproteobacteria bacterium]|nr:hypothetical protein [Alphaproteobacteria bacterium]
MNNRTEKEGSLHGSDVQIDAVNTPVTPKNDIVRKRGEYPGEAGADWSYGATAKPETDERRLTRGNPPMVQGSGAEELEALMSDENSKPEKRPDPFAQDLSRTPPTKEQCEKDYLPEKRDTGNAIKMQPKDETGFPPDDESEFG